MVAHQLAVFADPIEILPPDDVRRRLTDIGHGLLPATGDEGQFLRQRHRPSTRVSARLQGGLE
jgi:hypothetical protein